MKSSKKIWSHESLYPMRTAKLTLNSDTLCVGLVVIRRSSKVFVGFWHLLRPYWIAPTATFFSEILFRLFAVAKPPKIDWSHQKRCEITVKWKLHSSKSRVAGGKCCLNNRRYRIKTIIFLSVSGVYTMSIFSG